MAALPSFAPRMVAATVTAIDADELRMQTLRRLTVEILRAAESRDDLSLAALKTRRRTLLDSLAAAG